jgi:Saxitoxin biosynthesis operon protein SxtJ
MLMKQGTFRAEREFGLIVGSVFVFMSAWWLYRGKLLGLAQITMPLGFTLIFLALAFPRALVYPRKVWMLFGEALSFVTTRVVLAIVFFLLVTPIGVAKRMFGWDPLYQREGSKRSYWRPYSKRQRDPRHYEKMY